MKKSKKYHGTPYEIRIGIQRMGVGKPIVDSSGLVAWNQHIGMGGPGSNNPDHAPRLPLRSGTIPLMLRSSDGILRVAA